MNRRQLPVAVCLFAALVAAVAVSRARADGPPQGIAAEGTGIVSPDGKVRYFTWTSGAQTVLEAVDTHGGTLVNEVLLRGRFEIPAIAWTPTGITPDGKTLVLTTNPLLDHSATFLVLSVPGFETQQVVTLRGSWSYDAISPNARTLYLIQSLAARNGSRYLVRAYDLRSRRLVRRVIADRRETGPMTGSPVARATTRDGRWAYTLYTRGNGTAFVHALDTVHLAAVCVDLPWRDWGRWSVGMWVSRDGRRLHLQRLGNGGKTVVLDTRAWRVRSA